MRENTIVQKKCKSCGKFIDEKWNFCPYCKDGQVKIKCISCKNDLEPAWNYCPFCKNRRNVGDRDEVLESGNDWLKEILKK